MGVMKRIDMMPKSERDKITKWFTNRVQAHVDARETGTPVDPEYLIPGVDSAIQPPPGVGPAPASWEDFEITECVRPEAPPKPATRRAGRPKKADSVPLFDLEPIPTRPSLPGQMVLMGFDPEDVP